MINEATIGYYRLTESLSLFEVVLSMMEKEKDECSFENAEAIHELLESIHENMMNARKNIKEGMDKAGLWEGS